MRRDENGWSISLGTWLGVNVRVHIVSFLFAAVTLLLGWQGLSSQSNSSSVAMVWVAAFALLAMGLSVLVHEFGHLLATLRFGGRLDAVILWPLGGLAPAVTPTDPLRAVAVHLAGPAANLAVCVGMIPLMLVLGVVPLDVLSLLNPLVPTGLMENFGALDFVRLAFWVNWLLAIVNLVPAYPFDGGRALRAWLAGIWKERGREQIDLVIARVAFFAGLTMFVAAWFARNLEGGFVPVWFALVLLGIFLLFSARQEAPSPAEPEVKEDDRLFGYDFSEGYTSLERSSHFDDAEDIGAVAQWVEQRRLSRMQQEEEAAEADDRRMDEILCRVHQEGLGSLSREEREVLNRVSARYRNRNS